MAMATTSMRTIARELATAYGLHLESRPRRAMPQPDPPIAGRQQAARMTDAERAPREFYVPLVEFAQGCWLQTPSVLAMITRGREVVEVLTEGIRIEHAAIECWPLLGQITGRPTEVLDEVWAVQWWERRRDAAAREHGRAEREFFRLMRRVMDPSYRARGQG